MSKQLTFMMGEFKAEFPTDRRYAKNHMWALQHRSDQRYRFGFTAYAARLLQDVYFLDWTIDAPSKLTARQPMGAIESKKAESELYAPMSGSLLQFNAALMNDPSMINLDKYGEGWLFEMTGPGNELLSAEDYLTHLDEVWVVTQRTIKGQLND